ncbi:MAG: helix-turn-helix domain-containing protein [Cyanobacteria bacterium P01_H01_bin.153]
MSVVLSSLIGFTSAIAHTRPAPLPDELQRCVEVIQRLEACREQPSYGAERQRAMQTLGVSERSLRRLQQQYRARGIEGLKRQPRADEGQPKVDERWREFILETYRKGNRGTRQMSRSQGTSDVFAVHKS